MGFEQAVTRDFPGEMVIEIAHARADLQCAEQRCAIDIQRDVEHREIVAAARRNLCKQRYVALDAGYERACARIGEPELVQGAQSVGVAIEDVIESHAAPSVADQQSPARRNADTT